MRTWWDDAEGTVLDDRYELHERIGRGGAGVVHRAWDRARRRPVAVKLLPAAGAAVDARTGRQEAEMLRALDHPQLVALHDVLITDDGVALVMELIDGPALVDRLDAGALPLEDAAVVLRDIAAGLAHAHARRIVHRDVKPGNVLLRQVDQRIAGAALADFGIARFAESTRVTTAATILGTIRYLSPEQVRGERATAASDVYSLGLTLLAAVTGRPAFPGSDAESLGGRLVRSPEMPELLPEDWSALLSAMTALQPEARPTAAEVAAAAARLGAEPAAILPLAPIAAADPFDEETRAIDAPVLASVATPRRRIPRFVGVAAAASTAVASLGLVLILTGAPIPFDQAGTAAIDRVDAPSASASARPSATGSAAVVAPRAATVHAATAARPSAPAATTAAVRPTTAPKHETRSAGSSSTRSAARARPAAKAAPVVHEQAPKHVAHKKASHKKAAPKKAAPKKATAKKSSPKKAAPKKAISTKRGHGGGGHGKH